MRKKFSIDAKKVFAFEMTAPLETILVAQVVKGRGGVGEGGGGSSKGGKGGGAVGGEGYFII